MGREGTLLMFYYEIDELRKYADTFFILQESGKLRDMSKDELESLLRTTHFQLRKLIDAYESKRPPLEKALVKAYISQAIDEFNDQDCDCGDI
jgi:hypothetical protein